MAYPLGALLLLVSPSVWCCTCGGILPIEVAIADLPNLVEGQVVSLEQHDSPEFGKLTHSATLHVSKVLKGSVGSSEITVVNTMCYASVYPGNMQLHHTYVLPLSLPAEELPVEEGRAVALIGPAPGQYEMAQCAHSGLERINGELYSFREGVGLQRRVERYMPYAAFRVWWPVAQAGIAAVAFVLSLHQRFGVPTLMLSLLLGTTSVYFAARYKPWMLIAAGLVALLLCASTFVELLPPLAFSTEHGFLYRALSWTSPAIVLAGGAFGYITRRRVGK